MVGKTFSAVIKLDYVLDSPKTRLFIPGKDKLAKYMVCVTTCFKVRDHYFFRNWNLSVFRRDKLADCKRSYLWLERLLVQ
jgi:hypothetical protein